MGCCTHNLSAPFLLYIKDLQNVVSQEGIVAGGGGVPIWRFGIALTELSPFGGKLLSSILKSLQYLTKMNERFTI